MNNDSDLNMHSMTKCSGWLHYCKEHVVKLVSTLERRFRKHLTVQTDKFLVLLRTILTQPIICQQALTKEFHRSLYNI